MDFISWTETIKLIMLIVATGLMIALIVAVLAVALFASVVVWHGMKAKKTSEELLKEAVNKLDEDEHQDTDID